MIVSKFAIENFKSIESAELELGTVNVFIGANGSGKSNLLEALGVLAAAAFGRVDEESLVRRGCRPGGYPRPLFKDSEPEGLTKLDAEAKTGYQVTLSSPEFGRVSGWEYRREIWSDEKGGEIFNRTLANGDKGDPQAGLAALRLAETAPETGPARFLKRLAAYSIYSPDTAILRGWRPDTQNREPIGLSGGRLADAVLDLISHDEGGGKLESELKDAVEWYGGFRVRRTLSIKEPVEHRLLFTDRFFRQSVQPYYLTPNDVNEGVLYLLFLGVLCLHPNSPALFAVDNGDHGLNPLLARQLIQAMCGWLLEGDRARQVLMTTQNPLVLDGLPLQDERVRLFTVDRDNRGATNVRRFVITDKHRELAKEGWTLSRMWVNKLIGGVPNI
jgi:predicted ATPase